MPHTHDQHRPAGKRPRRGRTTERAAIRAAAAIFEDAGMHVQEVDASNDIGKDLYVDLLADGVFTGELIALQVKGGGSYRTSDGGHHLRCSLEDRILWAHSPVPVFGLIHDPESGALFPITLTAWSRAQQPDSGTLTAVASRWPLERQTLPQFLLEARSFLRASGPPALVGLVDDDDEIQIQAIWDAFALGCHDARPLLLVRRCLLDLHDDALAQAVSLLNLALTPGHGDILWSGANWIDDEVRRRVDPELRRWSIEEAVRMLALPVGEEWSRGGLGQDVAALIGAGWAPDVEQMLRRIAVERPLEAAWPALALLVNESGESGPDVFAELVPRSPALRASTLVAELGSVLAECGSAHLW